MLRQGGAFDLFAYCVNIPFNGALVVAGGAGLLSVSSVALNALGFEGMATVTSRAVPVVLKIAGVTGVVALGGFAVILAQGVRSAIGAAR